MGPVAPRPEVRSDPRSDRVRLLGARVRPTTYSQQCARGPRPYKRPKPSTPHWSAQCQAAIPNALLAFRRCAESARAGESRRKVGSARNAPIAGWRGCRPGEGPLYACERDA
eukprot:scaffold12537_cov72-Phaeocystis_antarctica.AAC.6